MVLPFRPSSAATHRLVSRQRPKTKNPTGRVRALTGHRPFSGFFNVARKPVGSNHHAVTKTRGGDEVKRRKKQGFENLKRLSSAGLTRGSETAPTSDARVKPAHDNV